MSNEQLIAISVDEYERARLCVNACRGASDEWLRAWSKLENPGMSLSESLQYWITRHCEEAEKRAALEKALSATVAQRDELIAICERVVENGIGFSDVKAMQSAIANVKGADHV